jgi:hypothetical protein
MARFATQIGHIHIIQDIGADDKMFSWTGKLLDVFGKNLLFEKRNGCHILVDPFKVTKIIELKGQ